MNILGRTAPKPENHWLYTETQSVRIG